MKAGWYIPFDQVPFRETIAHGGHGAIRWARVLTSCDGIACNFVDCTIIPSGSEIGSHKHGLDSQEVYIILQGEGQMLLEDATFSVAAGDIIINGAGGTHGLKNAGKEDLKLVVIELLVPE